jgi:hypothetical protein
MDFDTGRLEGSARVQERPFGKSSDEPKRRVPRRPKPEAEVETVAADEEESHQLDDLA